MPDPHQQGCKTPFRPVKSPFRPVHIKPRTQAGLPVTAELPRDLGPIFNLSLIHISEPTRLDVI
eukprot:3344377-Prorocentrum_lima.AAC.1